MGSAAPPKETESALDADKRTRSEGAKVNRVLDNREEAEKARQEDHRHDPGGSIEAKYATGFSRQAGKHTDHTGPLTRGGRLKIFPESSDLGELHGDLENLREIAKQVLRDRNATIFEKLVIKPLEDGVRRPPVEEVAAQFNIKDKRVYKILDKCWDRVAKARARFEAGAPLIEKERSPMCSICGRPQSSNEICPRGRYGGCKDDPPRPGVCSSEAFPPEVYARWAELEAGEEARLEKYRRDYLEGVMRRWENTYGVNRPDGPKRHGK